MKSVVSALVRTMIMLSNDIQHTLGSVRVISLLSWRRPKDDGQWDFREGGGGNKS